MLINPAIDDDDFTSTIRTAEELDFMGERDREVIASKRDRANKP